MAIALLRFQQEASTGQIPARFTSDLISTKILFASNDLHRVDTTKRKMQRAWHDSCH
jgi:hypothetical protein